MSIKIENCLLPVLRTVKETGMKEKDIREETDLNIAKEFLNNMLSPLSDAEKKQMLKMLLELTKDI